MQLRLDLDDNAHLAVLRRHLDRHARTVITEAPGPAGWIDGRPAELLLTLTHTAPATGPTRPSGPRPHCSTGPGSRRGWSPPARPTRRHPRPTSADRADRLLPAGWWFLRYPDPEPHLRLRIPLAQRGRVRRHRPHASPAVDAGPGTMKASCTTTACTPTGPKPATATGPTLAAAEAVFAADSRAVLRRLAGDRRPPPPPHDHHRRRLHRRRPALARRTRPPPQRPAPGPRPTRPRPHSLP